MDLAEEEIDLSSVARTLWRGKWIVLLCVILCGALGYFYATEVAQKVYKSSAVVSITNQQSQVTDLDALVDGLSAEQPSLNTEIYLIRSRQLLGRLVESEGLLDDPEFNPLLEQINPYSIDGLLAWIMGPPDPIAYSDDQLTRIATDRLISRLSVSNPRSSFVFEISVTANSPSKSTDLANALAETYINDQLLYKVQQSAIAIEFLAQRTASLQTELNEAELEAKDFAAGIELISPATLAAKNRQVKELRDRLNGLDAQIAGLEAQILALDDFDVETATAPDVARFGNSAMSDLFAVLATDPGATQRLELVVATERRQTAAALSQTQAQFASLTNVIAELEVEVSAESRDLLRLQQLQREAEAVGEIYGYFLTRLKEAEVQQGTQQPDVRLLSAAVAPLRPVSPRKTMIMAVAVVIGLI